MALLIELVTLGMKRPLCLQEQRTKNSIQLLYALGWIVPWTLIASIGWASSALIHAVSPGKPR